VALTIARDDDLLINSQELLTATAHDAASILLVLNNGTYCSYGASDASDACDTHDTMRIHHECEYSQRISGLQTARVDFAKLAEAYAYHVVQITHTDQFEVQLPAALARWKESHSRLVELMISQQVMITSGNLSAIKKQALLKK
jgi:acetolactate synthase I/II/III large subunit